MDISIIVPSYNEEKNIGQCLESLIKQKHSGNFEIIVADGNSKDETKTTVREFAKTHSNVRLIIEPKKGVAAGRNAAVKSSRYDYVAFIDADCEAPPDWLSILTESIKLAKSRSEDIIAVGGRNIVPPDVDRFPKAIEIALDSYIGSFGSIQGRQFNKPSLVSSLSTANALYEKKKIMEINCFDESLKSEAEDADLNFHLNRCGYRFLFIPASFVWHKMRLDPLAWFKNMFRYGKGRARLLKRHPSMWNFSYLLPLLFIAAMVSLVFIPVSKFFYIPLLYFPFIFSFSFFQCLKNKSLALTLDVAFVYFIQHFAYASGQAYGLINPGVK